MKTTAAEKTNLLKFGFLCAVICWQICVLNLWVVTPFVEGDGLSWKRAPNEYFVSDFLHYYTSGVMARSPDRLRIYDVPAHFPYMNALIAPREVKKDSYIQYSPPQIAVMSVVTLIPLVPAYIIWTITVTIFGSISLFLLLRKVGLLSTYQSVLFVLFTSASLSSLTAIKMGQWTWLLTGLFCWFFLASFKKKEILAGICLGLLTFKPQYCLPLMIVTALQKRFISLTSMIVVVAILSLWSINLLGWENVWHYPKIVADFAVHPDLQVDALCYCSLRSFISRFLPIEIAIQVTSILYFGALTLFGAVCFLKRNALNKHINWVWAIAILISLIFAPLMFQYDAMLAYIPAALTMRSLNPFEINRMTSLPLKIWHWVFLCYPAFSWARSFLGNEWNFLYAFLFVPLLICALIYLRQSTKERDNFEHAKQ